MLRQVISVTDLLEKNAFRNPTHMEYPC